MFELFSVSFKYSNQKFENRSNIFSKIYFWLMLGYFSWIFTLCLCGFVWNPRLKILVQFPYSWHQLTRVYHHQRHQADDSWNDWYLELLDWQSGVGQPRLYRVFFFGYRFQERGQSLRRCVFYFIRFIENYNKYSFDKLMIYDYLNSDENDFYKNFLD